MYSRVPRNAYGDGYRAQHTVINTGNYDSDAVTRTRVIAILAIKMKKIKRFIRFMRQ